MFRVQALLQSKAGDYRLKGVFSFADFASKLPGRTYGKKGSVGPPKKHAD